VEATFPFCFLEGKEKEIIGENQPERNAARKFATK
jgi:hypothetical protein